MRWFLRRQLQTRKPWDAGLETREDKVRLYVPAEAAQTPEAQAIKKQRSFPLPKTRPKNKGPTE